MVGALHALSLLSGLFLATGAFAESTTGSLGVDKRDDATGSSSHLEKRLPPQIRYNDGSYLKTGRITPTIAWQASGRMSTMGSCAGAWVNINDCYFFGLASEGMYQETTARRRKRSLIERGVTVGIPKGPEWKSEDEEEAASDDFALDAYRRAFPEQFTNAPPLVNQSSIPAASSPENLDDIDAVASANDQIDLGVSFAAAADDGEDDDVDRRQRIEIYTWPGAANGTTWEYTWRSYLTPGVGTTNHFFHLWQILRRDSYGGPVIAMDAKRGQIAVVDYVRGCSFCETLPLDSFVGKTIQNRILIRYGPAGGFEYYASDVNDPAGGNLITYAAAGDMGTSASLKFGLYRIMGPGMTAVTGMYGDLTQRRVT